jgi:hypothetical protein
MQFSAESIAALIGIVGSFIHTGVLYGIMKTKVDRLERELEKSERKFVTVDLFDATINPLREDIHEMQRDVKKILVAVQRESWGESESD